MALHHGERISVGDTAVQGLCDRTVCGESRGKTARVYELRSLRSRQWSCTKPGCRSAGNASTRAVWRFGTGGTGTSQLSRRRYESTNWQRSLPYEQRSHGHSAEEPGTSVEGVSRGRVQGRNRPHGRQPRRGRPSTGARARRVFAKHSGGRIGQVVPSYAGIRHSGSYRPPGVLRRSEAGT